MRFPFRIVRHLSRLARCQAVAQRHALANWLELSISIRPLEIQAVAIVANPNLQHLVLAVVVRRYRVARTLGAEHFPTLPAVMSPVEKRECRVTLITVLALLVVYPKVLLGVREVSSLEGHVMALLFPSPAASTSRGDAFPFPTRCSSRRAPSCKERLEVAPLQTHDFN